jgi:hypothetical protein
VKLLERVMPLCQVQGHVNATVPYTLTSIVSYVVFCIVSDFVYSLLLFLILLLILSLHIALATSFCASYISPLLLLIFDAEKSFLLLLNSVIVILNIEEKLFYLIHLIFSFTYPLSSLFPFDYHTFQSAFNVYFLLLLH